MSNRSSEVGCRGNLGLMLRLRLQRGVELGFVRGFWFKRGGLDRAGSPQRSPYICIAFIIACQSTFPEGQAERVHQSQVVLTVSHC